MLMRRAVLHQLSKNCSGNHPVLQGYRDGMTLLAQQTFALGWAAARFS
jgi:hypothetical protein